MSADIRTDTETSELWQQCLCGSVEDVREVLARGVDVNYASKFDSKTCLMGVVRRGQLDMMEELLQSPHIDVNR